MDYGRIEKLLEKYWSCETTVEEEEELRLFFTREEEMPEHLSRYTSLFVFQRTERKVGLNDSFDERILRQIDRKQGGARMWLTLGMRLAAVFVLFIGMGLLYRHMDRMQKPEPADTYQNPAEALAQVEKTLMLVSDKMMQGQKKAERNIEKTETLIKYIN